MTSSTTSGLLLGLRRLVVMVALGAMVAVTALAAPASAASKTVKDPKGNGWGGPDIRSITYRNTDTRVVMVARFANLRRNDSVVLNLQAPGELEQGAGYVLSIERGSHEWQPGPEITTPEWPTCDGIATRWNIRKDVVRAVIPRSCIRDKAYRGRLYFLTRASTQDQDKFMGFEEARAVWVARG